MFKNRLNKVLAIYNDCLGTNKLYLQYKHSIYFKNVNYSFIDFIQ